MRLFIIFILTSISFISKAQQTLFIKVTGGENKTPLAASILLKGTTKGYAADSNGTVAISFPVNGNYTLIASAVGYEEKQIKITIPHNLDSLEIKLESSELKKKNTTRDLT